MDYLVNIRVFDRIYIWMGGIMKRRNWKARSSKKRAWKRLEGKIIRKRIKLTDISNISGKKIMNSPLAYGI